MILKALLLQQISYGQNEKTETRVRFCCRYSDLSWFIRSSSSNYHQQNFHLPVQYRHISPKVDDSPSFIIILPRVTQSECKKRCNSVNHASPLLKEKERVTRDELMGVGGLPKARGACYIGRLVFLFLSKGRSLSGSSILSGV